MKLRYSVLKKKLIGWFFVLIISYLILFLNMFASYL